MAPVDGKTVMRDHSADVAKLSSGSKPCGWVSGMTDDHL